MTDSCVLVICCEKTKETLDEAGLTQAVMTLPCLGRIDEAVLLRAFRKGADCVIVAGCVDGNCRYSSGNYQARRCVNEVKSILEEIGVESERLDIVSVAPNDFRDLQDCITRMNDAAAKLGRPRVLEG